MFTNSVYEDLNFEFKDRPKRVLALISPRKSGKSFISSVLTEMDSRISQKAFADPIKEMLSQTTGIPIGDLYHQDRKEKYREAIIDLSWKMKREKGFFYWAESYFNSLIDPMQITVCDDMRLQEELQLLCMFGGVAYRVWADPHQRKAWGWNYNPAVDDEISEQDLIRLSAYDLYCCTGGGFIYNNKPGKDHLIPQLSQIVAKHFPQPIISTIDSGSLSRMAAMEL